jgi:hypothetical protein
MSDLTLKDLYFKFRNPETIKALANEIKKEAKKFKRRFKNYGDLWRAYSYYYEIWTKTTTS